MQRTTTPEQKEPFTSPSDAGTENSKNYPLLTREPLEGTPFWIVGVSSQGYKLTWGKFTFNDQPLPTTEDVIEWYKKHQWEITLHLIAIGIAAHK